MPFLIVLSFPIIYGEFAATIPSVKVTTRFDRDYMTAYCKNKIPFGIIVAKIFYCIGVGASWGNYMPLITFAFEICAPYVICRRHIVQIAAMDTKPQKNLAPGLPGRLADCPDGAISDTDARWIDIALLESVICHRCPSVFLRCTHQTDSHRISESEFVSQKVASRFR